LFENPNLTRPHSVVGNVCTISFRDPYYVQRSRGEKQRQLVEEALSWVLGYDCRLESITFEEAATGVYAPEGEPKESSAREVTREKPSPYETPRGKAAMNIFGITKFDDTSKES
jgi:hypothetical protein